MPSFQVHDDGAVALPLAPRPIIDPHDPRGLCWFVLESLDPPEQRIGAGGYRRACGEAGEPMFVCVWRSRSVVRAHGAANPGRRSAKMRRGQPDCGQTKRRTATWSRTHRPRQGRSLSWRVYRLCTRRVSWPHSGQAAVGAVVARWTVRLSTSRQARTRELPSGAPSNSSGSNMRLQRYGTRGVHIVRDIHSTSVRHRKCGRTQIGLKLPGEVWPACCHATEQTRPAAWPLHAALIQRGDRATCLYRDAEVVITSWTDARISWPRGHGIGVRGGSGC